MYYQLWLKFQNNVRYSSITFELGETKKNNSGIALLENKKLRATVSLIKQKLNKNIMSKSNSK
jgi:hypothetical protein